MFLEPPNPELTGSVAVSPPSELLGGVVISEGGLR